MIDREQMMAEAAREIDPPAPVVTKCIFDLAWIGKCKQPTVPGENFCEKHLPERCCVCKGQATRECDATFSLVCGAPLCDTCRHH